MPDCQPTSLAANLFIGLKAPRLGFGRFGRFGPVPGSSTDCGSE